jgi:hypothetical protein
VESVGKAEFVFAGRENRSEVMAVRAMVLVLIEAVGFTTNR